MTKLLYGVGVDDTDYQKSKRDPSGKAVVLCQIYRKWQNMLCRCYNQAYRDKHPSYIGTSVCEEWLTFSRFKQWAELQAWSGNELDKDLLDPLCGEYNKDSCCFISGRLNKFIVQRKPSSYGMPTGVRYDERYGNYVANCNNPFLNKKEHLGVFNSPYDAHLAWKARKLEFAIELGKLESDERALPALIRKYS